MTATVMCDASVAILGEEEHLILEGVRRQRPAVTEDDRLSRSPVFVVNLRAIFCCDISHDLSPLQQT
jgi:hypothetical protein